MVSVGHSAAPSKLISQSNASLVAKIRYGLILLSCNKRSILVRRSVEGRPHFSKIVGLGVVEETTGGSDDDDEGAGVVVGVIMIGKLLACCKRVVQN